MSDRKQELPYGVGKFGLGYLAFMVVMACIFGLGVHSYVHELIVGPGATGMRDIRTSGGAAWGVYIAFYVFFVGVSFPGITLAALIRLLDIEILEPAARLAELLAVIALLLAGLAVMADLGQPLHGLIYLPKFARPMSPFYGTFTLVVAGYFFASFVYLYLTGRRDAALCAQKRSWLRWFHLLWAAGYRDTPGERARHARATWWLALFIIPLLVAAHSTLGWVFGIQVGRPGWYGSLQAPGFVVLAGVSGIGFLVMLVPVVRWAGGLQDVISTRVYPWLGNFLWVLSAVYLYFILSEWLTVAYAGRQVDKTVEHSLTHGVYAPLFYTAVGSLGLSFFLPLMSFVMGRWSLWLLVPAGFFANVGAVLKRYLLVVSSQTHGSMLHDPPGTHQPVWQEWSVILGLFALGAMMYATFMKVFPIAPIQVKEAEGADLDLDELELAEADDPVRGRRHLLFVVTLLVGISMAVAGFSLSPGDVPRSGVPFAPVVFIGGIMLTFLSAVVYELVAEFRFPSAASSRTKLQRDSKLPP